MVGVFKPFNGSFMSSVGFVLNYSFLNDLIVLDLVYRLGKEAFLTKFVRFQTFLEFKKLKNHVLNCHK